MTAHNSFFGWIHCLSWGNGLLGSSGELYNTPYPPIVRNPSVKQIIQNWNLADTGMAISLTVLTMVLAARKHNRIASTSIFEQKQHYSIAVLMAASLGVLFGLRNSVYRLEGLVPNGLAPYEVEEPVKYNYRGPFL